MGADPILRDDQAGVPGREGRPAKGFWKRFVFQKPSAVEPKRLDARLDLRHSCFIGSICNWVNEKHGGPIEISRRLIGSVISNEVVHTVDSETQVVKVENSEKNVPLGLKPDIRLLAFAARLKPFPFKT